MSSADINDIIQIVVCVTGDSVTADSMTDSTQLLGAMPEIDSMGIINIILALEKRFGFQIEDEEVEQSVFETTGSLLRFVQAKLDTLPPADVKAI